MSFEFSQTATHSNTFEEKQSSEKFLGKNFEKRAFDFKQAIEMSLLSDREIDGNEEVGDNRLTAYEKSLIIEGKIPKINMLVDIDGVLIDTEEKISEILEILKKDFNVLDNVKQAKNMAGNTKIPFSSLRILLKCKAKAEKITLITDRFGKGPCCFPCFNKKGKKVFEDKGIGVMTDTYKFSPISSAKSLEPIVASVLENEITYYIGSSNSDRKYVERIRKELDKAKISQDNLVYIHVEPENRKNIL